MPKPLFQPRLHAGLAVLGAAAVLAACSKPAPPEEPIRAVKVLTVGADVTAELQMDYPVVDSAPVASVTQPATQSVIGTITASLPGWSRCARSGAATSA